MFGAIWSFFNGLGPKAWLVLIGVVGVLVITAVMVFAARSHYRDWQDMQDLAEQLSQELEDAVAANQGLRASYDKLLRAREADNAAIQARDEEINAIRKQLNATQQAYDAILNSDPDSRAWGAVRLPDAVRGVLQSASEDGVRGADGSVDSAAGADAADPDAGV